MTDITQESLGVALGFAAALAVFGIAQVIAEKWNPFDREVGAIAAASGVTALVGPSDPSRVPRLGHTATIDYRGVRP
jgi:hypothetical protein